MLSWWLLSSGLTAQMIAVREFPPRYGCSILVSLDSRKPTKASFLFSLLMTLKTARRLLLIEEPSLGHSELLQAVAADV